MLRWWRAILSIGLIQPAEVARAVVWLCAPGTESVTGQSLAIAGGEVM